MHVASDGRNCWCKQLKEFCFPQLRESNVGFCPSSELPVNLCFGMSKGQTCSTPDLHVMSLFVFREILIFILMLLGCRYEFIEVTDQER